MSRSTLTTLGLALTSILTIGESFTPDRALALSPTEVGKVAKQVTVAIKSTAAEYGSGIIIQHRGSTYTVLTSAHVLRNASSGYNLTTPDGQTYQLQAAKIKKFPGQVDLAVAQFTSDRSYPIAKIGDSNSVEEGNAAFVSGFPAPTAAINLPVYVFRKGDIVANSTRPLQGGYAIIYSANTLPGMSGGGVFNDRGELIATHGRGDVAESYRTDTENPAVRFKTGNDLGIPVNTFRQYADRLTLDLGNSAPPVAAKPTTAPKADDYILAAEGKNIQGNYRGAVADLDRAIAINPRSTKAYISRATNNFLLNNSRAAVDDANRALKIKPNEARAFTIRAAAKIALSDLAGASTDAARAISLSPDLSEAYSIRGLTKLLNGEYPNAIADLDRSIALDPTSADAYTLRSQARRFLGNLTGARSDIDYVIGRKTNLAEAYGHRSIIKLAQNDNVGAKADAELSIKLNPNTADQANAALGKLAFDANNYQQAVEYTTRALKITNFNLSAFEIRSLAYLKLKQPQLAIDDANVGLKLSPQDYPLYVSRGAGYAMLGNKAAHLRDWRAALKIMRDLKIANTDDYRQLQEATSKLEGK